MERSSVVNSIFSILDHVKILHPLHIRLLRQAVTPLLDKQGRAGEELVTHLQLIERSFTFTPKAFRHFQDLLGEVGVASTRTIGLPGSDMPYWLCGEHPWRNYQSQPQLPEVVDIVIIGAGLTGSAAAYFLKDQVARVGLRVAILEQGDPAGEASGRNGGNIELLPENAVTLYTGLQPERLKFLKRCYPGVHHEILMVEAARQASVVLGFALRNRQLLKEIVAREGIDCDLSPFGWLYVAHKENEEQAICDEVMLAAKNNLNIEIWSRMKVRNEFGFDAQHIGRFSPDDGTYHPFKYVCGLLRCAIRQGVELYTRTKVQQVKPSPKEPSAEAAQSVQCVVTNRGEIFARCVIVATNAFTSLLFPELKAIQPRQSQVSITKFVLDRCRGRLVTSEEGPVYFNQPRDGMFDGRAPLLMGGGKDRLLKNPQSRRRSKAIHAQLLAHRDRYFPELHGQPFASEWIGAMGFTPDQLPAVGALRPGIIIAMCCNGYGGSYTTATGKAVAELALTGNSPAWVPEDVFSPLRLLERTPLFLAKSDSLYRIGEALCTQLSLVNQQISYMSSLWRKQLPVEAEEESTIDWIELSKIPTKKTSIAKMLQKFPRFGRFSLKEITRILEGVKRHELQKGELLFRQGDPGKTCCILLSGKIHVSYEIFSRQYFLGSLLPGNIFGQIGFFLEGKRSATCTAAQPSVILEADYSVCCVLLNSSSKLALKFLDALIHDLIIALRAANQRLLEIEVGKRGPQKLAL